MVDSKMNALTVLRKELEERGGDLPREMLKAFAERLMSAEADVLCGADDAAVTETRAVSSSWVRPSASSNATRNTTEVRGASSQPQRP